MRERVADCMQVLWYRRRTAPVYLLPLSFLFAAVAALRRLAFAVGLRRAVRVQARVVVVGNIAVGGSGKTPLAAWLARELTAAGWRVGIVSRGYGRADSAVRRVSPETPPAQAGDEAAWLARTTGVPVAVGRDRVAAARELFLESPPPDVIISDDGLQHYRLARDVEIVAVDAGRGYGNGALLPAGPLREPVRRLARADAVVLKGEGTPRVPTGPRVFRMQWRLDEAVRLCDGARRPLSEFRGTPVRALAGIAHPEGFFSALETAGLHVERHSVGDHGPVGDVVRSLPGDRPLMVTDKDAVKLTDPPDHVWRVPLAVAFSPDEAHALVALATGGRDD